MDAGKMEYAAQEIMNLCRNNVMLNLRFMDRAMDRMPAEAGDRRLAICPEGLVYQPAYVIRQFAACRTEMNREYVHCLMHCIFLHMYAGPQDRLYWDLACDMAAEAMLMEMDLPFLKTSETDRRRQILAGVREQLPALTAERLVGWLKEREFPEGQMELWVKLFHADDHDTWYESEPQDNPDGQEGGGRDSPFQAMTAARGGLDAWKEIAEGIELDLETFSKEQGDTAGSLLQSLREFNREKYDYASFLRQFAEKEEVMRIDPDTFDPVFYTFGLRTYGNMPLIEPTEYREDRRIRELVIAIDTSGSVQGELVQAFMQKTYNILKSTETFARRFRICIIQCDAEVQDAVMIHTEEEFDSWLAGLTLKGFGGTDFRPVFARVDRLIEEGQLPHLRGLLYFTDGWGTFPAVKPAYDTAFVFMDTDCEAKVPVWAMKIVLNRNEMEGV